MRKEERNNAPYRCKRHSKHYDRSILERVKGEEQMDKNQE